MNSKDDIAKLGNGHNEDISKGQYEMIEQLYDNTKPLQEELIQKIATTLGSVGNDTFCDYETCRRFLVARQWNLYAAEKQLISTLKWRIEHTHSEGIMAMEFWQSPKPLQNPHALNMRCIGLDRQGRPVTYTCFAEAHDRFDSEAVKIHVALLLESLMKMIKKRRAKGLNETAASRQWVWLVDFDGFALRDNNPKMGLKIIKLAMDHYPEMMHSIVLINAPILFSSTWKIAQPLLDDKVRSKVLFVKGEANIKEKLGPRLGDDITNWIFNELKDNQSKRINEKKNGYKKYWISPKSKDDHDPRGIRSYVNSMYYIKTPGDTFEEKQC